MKEEKMTLSKNAYDIENILLRLLGKRVPSLEIKLFEGRFTKFAS